MSLKDPLFKDIVDASCYSGINCPPIGFDLALRRLTLYLTLYLQRRMRKITGSSHIK